jgi:hypothetical protein
MTRPETRVSQSRWHTLGSMALAIAAVAVIGFTSVVPARADDDDWRYRRGWHEREWREHARREEWREYHPRASIYFSTPGYYDYSYSYYR